jgi:hypothetical protein
MSSRTSSTSIVSASSRSSTEATSRPSPSNTVSITSTIFISSGSSQPTAIVFNPLIPNEATNLDEQVNNGLSSGPMLAIIVACLIIGPWILLYLYRALSLLFRSKNLKKASKEETLTGTSSAFMLASRSLSKNSSSNDNSKDRMTQLAVRTMAVTIAESVASEDDIYIRSTFPSNPSNIKSEVVGLKRNTSLPSFGYAPRYQPVNHGNSVVSENSFYEQNNQNNPSFLRDTNALFRYSQNFDNVRYQHSARYPELHHHSGYTQEYQLVNHPNQVYTQVLQTNPPSSQSSSQDTSSSPSSVTPLINPSSSALSSPPSNSITDALRSPSPFILTVLDTPANEERKN